VFCILPYACNAYILDTIFTSSNLFTALILPNPSLQLLPSSKTSPKSYFMRCLELITLILILAGIVSHHSIPTYNADNDDGSILQLKLGYGKTRRLACFHVRTIKLLAPLWTCFEGALRRLILVVNLEIVCSMSRTGAWALLAILVAPLYVF
jgi:hypothetical protein